MGNVKSALYGDTNWDTKRIDRTNIDPKAVLGNLSLSAPVGYFITGIQYGNVLLPNLFSFSGIMSIEVTSVSDINNGSQTSTKTISGPPISQRFLSTTQTYHCPPGWAIAGMSEYVGNTGHLPSEPENGLQLVIANLKNPHQTTNVPIYGYTQTSSPRTYPNETFFVNTTQPYFLTSITYTFIPTTYTDSTNLTAYALLVSQGLMPFTYYDFSCIQSATLTNLNNYVLGVNDPRFMDCILQYSKDPKNIDDACIPYIDNNTFSRDVVDYCSVHYENDTRCSQYCNQTNIDCNNIMNAYCATKYGGKTCIVDKDCGDAGTCKSGKCVIDPNNDRTCGCFLPKSVYDTYFASMSANIPTWNIPQDQVCYFPPCTESNVKPKRNVQAVCPNINQCVSMIKIDVNGNVDNSTINAKNIENCYFNNSPSCTTDKDCAFGGICKNSVCVLSSTPSPPSGGCQTDKDCGSNQTCQNGQCITNPSPPSPPSGGCHSNSDCPSNQVCQNSQCIDNKPAGDSNKTIAYLILGVIVFLFILILSLISYKINS